MTRERQVHRTARQRSAPPLLEERRWAQELLAGCDEDLGVALAECAYQQLLAEARNDELAYHQWSRTLLHLQRQWRSLSRIG